MDKYLANPLGPDAEKINLMKLLYQFSITATPEMRSTKRKKTKFNLIYIDPIEQEFMQLLRGGHAEMHI